MAGTPLLPHLNQATISRTESARVVPGYAVIGWVRGLIYFVLAERLLLAVDSTGRCNRLGSFSTGHSHKTR
ncbi:hypothetical protein D3C72_2263950 [compost metagenome]